MNEELLRLITAGVDGELSPSQRRRLHRLLSRHPEAPELLERLRADRSALERLPQRRLGPEFAEQVVHSLPPRPSIRTKRTVAVHGHAWWPLAAAAAILLAVSVAAALFVYDLTRPGPGRPTDVFGPVAEVEPSSESGAGTPSSVAAHQPNASSSKQESKTTGGEVAYEALPDDIFRSVISQDPGSDQSTAQAQTPSSGENPPAESEPPVLTAPPVKPLKGFKTLDLKLPLFLEPRQVDVEAVTRRLGSEPMHHLDIACLESARTFERLQAAFKAAGLKLSVESELSQRLSRKLPTPCLIYIENTSAAQMAALLKALEREEIRAEENRKGDAQITSILLQPLDENGRRHLADALGVSVSSVTPPSQRSPASAGVDPTRPLSEETLRSLEKVASKAREPSALAMIYLPNRSRIPPTKELKTFLDARLGMAPEAIHVVIYLRAARG